MIVTTWERDAWGGAESMPAMRSAPNYTVRNGVVSSISGQHPSICDPPHIPASDALLYLQESPVEAGLARTIPMRVKSLWRATLIALLSSLLRVYCSCAHFAGRYRQEQYP